MDSLPLLIEKISGTASEKTACGVFNRKITLDDEELATIALCVKIKDGKENDLQLTLGEIFEIIVKKLEGTKEGVLEAVKSATESGVAYAQDLGISSSSLVLCLFYKEACYIARAGDDVRVVVFDPPKSMEISFEYGSGIIKDNQMYILGTKAFFEIFDTAVFTNEAEVDLREIIDGLATEITADEKQAEIGAVFVQVGNGKKIDKEQKEKETVVAVEITEEEKEQEVDFGEEVPEPTEEHVVLKRGEDTGEKKAGVFNKFIESVKSLSFGFGRGQASLGVSKVRRNIIFLAIFLVIILASSVGYAIYNQNQKEKLKLVGQNVAAASSKYEEGLAVFDLNRARARELFIEADKSVKMALSIDRENDSAKKLEAEISQKLKETETQSTIDLSVLAQIEGSINSMSIAGNRLIVTVDDAVLGVDLKTNNVGEISKVSGIKDGFVSGNNIYLVSDNGILQLDLAGNKEAEKISDEGDALDISVFLGNVYALSRNRINKHVPIQDGWAEATSYLSQQREFGEDSRFAIDGSIWVTAGDRILEFLRGEDQGFEILGLLAKPSGFGEIFTSVNVDNLYVVDTANSALLVIGKDGVYKEVYQSPDFGRLSDLAVDEENGRIYIASGDKILQAPL